MTEKRFTTVELPKPNKWGIWYDGACLSTYQVCILLNEYVDVKKENEQLKSSDTITDLETEIAKLKTEIDTYKAGNKTIHERLKTLHEENTHIKNTIQTMIKNERTQMGQSVLQQLWEQIQ